MFKDTRTELQIIESILRTTSQILDPDQLQIRNQITKRNLHLSQAHNSGIPLLTQDITQQIKSYRTDEEHKKSILDNLYISKTLPELPPSEVSVPETQSHMLSAEDLQPIESDIPTEILTSSLPQC